MISCMLQGRTGNQMFQLSAAYAFAKRNGFEFVAPPVSANEELWPSKKFAGFKYSKYKGPTYFEPHFHYDDIPVRDDLILNGYFQSARYFQDFDKELLKIFGFSDNIYAGTCSVHVRRGDYQTYNKEFNLLPVEWYKKAIKKIGKAEFHFYSDDIEFCKKEFPGHIYHAGQPLQDMTEGAQHEHGIMSASSFSWWMCYPKTGKVIAPITWFGPKNSHHITKDLYLPSWIKM